jgi:uncharacterized damage-inducible protein DinB
MDIVSIFQYSTGVQRRLYDFLVDKPEAVAYQSDTIAEFKSVHDLLAHLNGCEQRWIVRILDQPIPERYELRAPEATHELYDDWRRLRSITEAAARDADPAELARPLSVKLQTSSITFTLTVEQILFHIVNHENFHRGQISMLLQQQHIDPPFFDYVYDFMPR